MGDVRGNYKMNPNSLKNLKPWTREGAQKGQKKSVESRMANKAAREALKVSMKDWRLLKEEFSEDAPSALDVLRIHMMKAIAAEDADEATRLAAVLAEFEAPKLQRQDITQVTSTTDLTDEELAEKLEEMGISQDSATFQ